MFSLLHGFAQGGGYDDDDDGDDDDANGDGAGVDDLYPFWLDDHDVADGLRRVWFRSHMMRTMSQ